MPALSQDQNNPASGSLADTRATRRREQGNRTCGRSFAAQHCGTPVPRRSAVRRGEKVLRRKDPKLIEAGGGRVTLLGEVGAALGRRADLEEDSVRERRGVGRPRRFAQFLGG